MEYSVKNIYKKTSGKAQVIVPGSKSITARALLAAALAKGDSALYNVQLSDDCQTFISCLKTLGIDCDIQGTTVKVCGCGGKLPLKSAKINVGSAGTAARFLTAMLAFCEGEFEVDSSAQMKRRPQAPLLKSLVSAGADVQSRDGTFPLKIRGCPSPKTEISVDITKSSQYLSALLMSAVLSKAPITIKAEGSHGRDYIDMTLDVMWSFGVDVKSKDGAYVVHGGYTAKKYEVEPDLSAASYFYAARRILGADISVRGVLPHSLQGDLKFIKLIENFDGGRVDMSSFSDQALTLAACAPYFSKPTEICGIGHTRFQECDRISAIVKNLSALGIRCEEGEDGVKIYPGLPKPAKLDTFGDHRVAMSFSLTGLRAGGIVIKDAEVCSKTFKNYFETLDKMIADLT